jgi:branched-chain amino acid transport system substrate-binding protein
MTAVLASAVLLLAIGACGREGGARVIKIGVIAPSSGALAALGTGITNSVRLAIEQANASRTIEGWTFELVAHDDASDPERGVKAAREIAADPKVAAVIGTYNSGVATKVQPILGKANIAMISPGNTDPTLTLGPDWQTTPKRPSESYFRLVSSDREQGLYGADYAYVTLARRRAVVIHESKPVSKGLALIFDGAFREKGGTVTEVIEADGDANLRAAVDKAASQDPDIVYIGGEYPAGGIIAKAMFDRGLRPPTVVAMGGDGLVDAEFVNVAGFDAAQGHYASLVGASTDFLPNAKQFTSDYEDRFGKKNWSAFGPPAFDATNIVVEALVDIVGNDQIDAELRRKLIQTIQGTDYSGVLGRTSFDAFGDTMNRLLTILRVEGDDWKALGADRL